MLQGMKRIKKKLLFAVVDEAQVAAVYLSDYFRSFTTGTDMRPVLHALHIFLWRIRIFEGHICRDWVIYGDGEQNSFVSSCKKHGLTHVPDCLR